MREEGVELMYGPTGKELGCALVLFATVAGLVFIGAEHGVVWIAKHLSVGWK